MPTPSEVKFVAKGAEPPANDYLKCRRMLVGPWVNQPEEYEGYNGFVGWAGITRFRSGKWAMTFTSGYWHGSLPWTPEIAASPEAKERFEEWHKIGMPNIYAPRGGRAHIMYSDDEGLTWTKPETLIDTPEDDRHPAILQAADGTWVCTYFTYAFPREVHSWFMYSTDQGNTWSKPKKLAEDADGGFGNGSAILLKSGTILCSVGGKGTPEREELLIVRSTDNGRTFKTISNIAFEGQLGASESPLAELPDGRLILISRRMGQVRFSEDQGKTWSAPKDTGVEMYDPHFVMTPTGVLACFHGSYNTGGIRVILSKDLGETWHGPAIQKGVLEKPGGIGYAVDTSVYGYCHPMLLPDGTVYLVYLHTGGHSPHDARTEAIWGLKVAISPDADVIEILPAPGSPADPKAGDWLTKLQFTGGDPELGAKV